MKQVTIEERSFVYLDKDGRVQCQVETTSARVDRGEYEREVESSERRAGW